MADNCLQCGGALKPVAKFCPGCGAKVEERPAGSAGRKGRWRAWLPEGIHALRRRLPSRDRGAAGYGFDLRTEGGRRTLEADGSDMLWVFAEVISNDPKVGAEGLTRGIRFKVEGAHADWVTLGRPQMKNGMKAVRVKAEPVGSKAELEESEEEVTVVASAMIDGKAYAGSVTLTLEDEARMKITIVESIPG